ncbi:putative T7SS-secreted protein [Kribbella sp. NPDC056861]|uniref:putative T7SS-secreted protein n=1 Tax=Kribbella sp. NPDC056861 TaxID=3154857 RepID=UPI0034139D0F
MARPYDWDSIGLPKDPTPGHPESIDRLAEALGRLGGKAREIMTAVDAVMNTADDSVFSGAAADALREKVDPRLRHHVEDVAHSFESASNSLREWSEIVRAQQARADAALAAGRGLPEDDDERGRQAGIARAAGEEQSRLGGEYSVRIAAVANIRLPVTRCQLFWEGLKLMALALLAPSLFGGVALALLAIGVNLALFVKAAVDLANGDGSVVDLLLAGLGMIAPTTKALPIVAIAEGIGKAVKAIGQSMAVTFRQLFSREFLFHRLIPGIGRVSSTAYVGFRNSGLWLVNGMRQLPRIVVHPIPTFEAAGRFTVAQIGRLGSSVGRGLAWTGQQALAGLGWIGNFARNNFGGTRWLRVFLPVDAAEIGEYGLLGALRIGFWERGVLGRFELGAPIPGLAGQTGRAITFDPALTSRPQTPTRGPGAFQTPLMPGSPANFGTPGPRIHWSGAQWTGDVRWAATMQPPRLPTRAWAFDDLALPAPMRPGGFSVGSGPSPGAIEVPRTGVISSPGVGDLHVPIGSLSDHSASAWRAHRLIDDLDGLDLRPAWAPGTVGHPGTVGRPGALSDPATVGVPVVRPPELGHLLPAPTPDHSAIPAGPGTGQLADSATHATAANHFRADLEDLLNSAARRVDVIPVPPVRFDVALAGVPDHPGAFVRVEQRGGVTSHQLHHAGPANRLDVLDGGGFRVTDPSTAITSRFDLAGGLVDRGVRLPPVHGGIALDDLVVVQVPGGGRHLTDLHGARVPATDEARNFVKAGLEEGGEFVLGDAIEAQLSTLDEAQRAQADVVGGPGGGRGEPAVDDARAALEHHARTGHRARIDTSVDNIVAGRNDFVPETGDRRIPPVARGGARQVDLPGSTGISLDLTGGRPTLTGPGSSLADVSTVGNVVTVRQLSGPGGDALHTWVYRNGFGRPSLIGESVLLNGGRFHGMSIGMSDGRLGRFQNIALTGSGDGTSWPAKLVDDQIVVASPDGALHYGRNGAFHRLDEPSTAGTPVHRTPEGLGEEATKRWTASVLLSQRDLGRAAGDPGTARLMQDVMGGSFTSKKGFGGFVTPQALADGTLIGKTKDFVRATDDLLFDGSNQPITVYRGMSLTPDQMAADEFVERLPISTSSSRDFQREWADNGVNAHRAVFEVDVPGDHGKLAMSYPPGYHSTGADAPPVNQSQWEITLAPSAFERTGPNRVEDGITIIPVRAEQIPVQRLDDLITAEWEGLPSKTAYDDFTRAFGEESFRRFEGFEDSRVITQVGPDGNTSTFTATRPGYRDPVTVEVVRDPGADSVTVRVTVDDVTEIDQTWSGQDFRYLATDLRGNTLHDNELFLYMPSPQSWSGPPHLPVGGGHHRFDSGYAETLPDGSPGSSRSTPLRPGAIGPDQSTVTLMPDGSVRWVDRAGQRIDQPHLVTVGQDGGVRIQVNTPGSIRHGEFHEFGADGKILRQGFNVLDDGKQTAFRYVVDRTGDSPTWSRTDLKDLPSDKGGFHHGAADLGPNGRIRLTSGTAGAVDVFERRTLPDGTVLDSFRRTDTVGFGSLNRRTTWATYDDVGRQTSWGTRHYDTSGRDWRDVQDLHTVREFREGLHKNDDLAGSVLGVKQADGNWRWHRYDGQGTEIASGPRVRESLGDGWTDRIIRQVDGVPTTEIAQRKWGKWHSTANTGQYQEFALSRNADGTVDRTGDWLRLSKQGKDSGSGLHLSDTTFLKVVREGEQRPPVWIREQLFGHPAPRDAMAHLADDSRFQIFRWERTGDDPAHGARYLGQDESLVDIDASGNFVRSARKLADGTELKVGDHASGPLRPHGDPRAVPWQAGDLRGYRVPLDGDQAGRLWVDVLDDVDGYWTPVREGRPGGIVREYQTPGGGQVWTERDAHGWLTGQSQRAPEPGSDRYVVASGRPESEFWTWREVDLNGTEIPGREGRRFHFRGSTDDRLAWDDSFRDFDVDGHLVRERRMLDDHRYVEAWREPPTIGGPRWRSAVFDGNGVRIGDDLTREWRIGDLWSSQASDQAVHFRDVRFRDGRPEVVREVPVHLEDSPLRIREYTLDLEGRPQYGQWKEIDGGKIARERRGSGDNFLETEPEYGQWKLYDRDGRVIGERTDNGLVFELRDGRLTLTGNEFDFRGPLTELRGWGRRVREPSRLNWMPESGSYLHPRRFVAPGGDIVLREARIAPYGSSVFQKVLLEFAQDFLLDFGANVMIGGIIAAANDKPYGPVDVLKALTGAVIGGTLKTVATVGLTDLRSGGMFRDFKRGLGNHDGGGHWATPPSRDTSWSKEYAGNEGPVRWRSGVFDFTFGLGIGTIAGFVVGATNSAVFGIQQPDGSWVPLQGWQAVGEGGIGALAGFTSSVSTGLIKPIALGMMGSRLIHRGGWGEFWMNGGLSLLEKSLNAYLGKAIRGSLAPPWYPDAEPAAAVLPPLDLPALDLPPLEFPGTELATPPNDLMPEPGDTP